MSNHTYRIDPSRLATYTNHIAVAVIGDLCLDSVFRSQKSSEISVETGKQVNHVQHASATPGGAAQVALLCKCLGFSTVDFYAVAADDTPGILVIDALTALGVDTSSVVLQKEHWDTHVYHKSYVDGAEQERHDLGWNNVLDDGVADRLLDSIAQHLDRYDCVIINQQVPSGIHSPRFVAGLNKIIRDSGVPWIADIRRSEDLYPTVLHKMNLVEAQVLAKQLSLDGTDAESCGRALVAHWNRPVVVTLSENGAVAFDEKLTHRELGFHIIKDIDPVGAGDAFLAGMALALSLEGTLADALRIGNLAAGTFIQKHTYPEGLSRQTIECLACEADYRFNPHIACNPRSAVYLPETEVEVINTSYKGVKHNTFPRVAIFDLDGTVSTLREGWDAIMQQSMLRFITGDAYEKLSAQELAMVAERIRTLIEKTTGVQTIIQMMEMCHLIDEFGYVKPKKRLSAFDYKELYANQVRALVKYKIHRFSTGQLALEDLTIKGSIALLTRLRNEGTTLYLASGTDETDVKHELHAFGYDVLFNGGIYGSVGDTKHDPKRLVMQIINERIAKENTHLDKGDCVVFGDGPVEIREGKKQGFMTVAMVSDEKQRFGINMHKRERLVLAGADFLIPDYSWIPQLSAYVGWE